MPENEPISAKKFAVSFIQAKPWIKNARFVIGLVIILLIVLTIYRAWFMQSGSQKSKHIVIALPGSKIEKNEQTTDQKLTQKRPWWQPIPYISVAGEARSQGSDLNNFQTGVKAEVHDINTKLFNHLINADLHVPRTQIVSRGAFDMYKMFKADEKATIIKQISDMKTDLIRKIDGISGSRR